MLRIYMQQKYRKHSCFQKIKEVGCYTFLMSPKTVIYTGMFIGSTIGSFIPMLWGASPFAISGVLLSGAGGIAGMVVGYRIMNG
jgi:hypothetical protein